MSNTLIKLLELYPEQGWDIDKISLNPNISIEYIKTNRDFFIHNWENISSRNDISFRDIINNPDLPWSYIGFSSNPNLVIETVKENLHLNWNWYSISSNENTVNDKVYLENPHLPWDYDGLSKNKNITWTIVQKNLDKDWNFMYLSTNSSITFDIVKKYINLAWDFVLLSRNPNITLDIVKNNKNVDWCMYEFSKNRNVTPNLVLNNPTFPWDHDGLSQNENFTLIDLHKLKIKISKCDLYYLSKDPKLDLEEVKKLKLSINPSGLSANPNITIDFIHNNPNFAWSYYGLSSNPNITSTIIEQNLEKFDWSYLSSNLFLKDEIAFQNYKNQKIRNIYISKLLKKDNRLYTDLNKLIFLYISEKD